MASGRATGFDEYSALLHHLSERQMSWRERIINTCLVAAIIVVVSGTGLRIYREYSVQQREFDWENRALSDFHNGVYYPSMAFRDGVSPYSFEAVEGYDLTRPAPPYAPTFFMLHLPLTYLPVHVADVVFVIANMVMLAVLAWMGIRYSGAPFNLSVFLSLVLLVLVSRPGHITLFTGYFTLELVIGVMLALQYGRSKPWLAGAGILLAAGKPTYVLPLVLLLFCRRNFKSVGIGIAFCVLGSVAGLGWLAAQNGIPELVTQVQQTQEVHHTDETEFPVNSWTRVDLLGLIAKVANWIPDDKTYLVTMLLMLVVPGWSIWQIADRESNPGATGLSAWLIVLSILLSIYHHSYDCLLLVVPWIGVTFYGQATIPEMSRLQRIGLSFFAAIPAANYLSTRIAQGYLQLEAHSGLWQAITMINGICLLAAFLLVLLTAMRIRAASTRSSTLSPAR